MCAIAEIPLDNILRICYYNHVLQLVLSLEQNSIHRKEKENEKNFITCFMHYNDCIITYIQCMCSRRHKNQD